VAQANPGRRENGIADSGRDNRRASEAVHNACFPCHQVAKARDFVFNRYAP